MRARNRALGENSLALPPNFKSFGCSHSLKIKKTDLQNNFIFLFCNRILRFNKNKTRMIIQSFKADFEFFIKATFGILK